MADPGLGQLGLGEEGLAGEGTSATNARVSQDAVSVAATPDAQARISQDAVSVAAIPDAKARVSQAAVAVAISMRTNARVSQAALSVLARGDANARLSGGAVSVAAIGSPDVEVDELYLEVAYPSLATVPTYGGRIGALDPVVYLPLDPAGGATTVPDTGSAGGTGALALPAVTTPGIDGSVALALVPGQSITLASVALGDVFTFDFWWRFDLNPDGTRPDVVTLFSEVTSGGDGWVVRARTGCSFLAFVQFAGGVETEVVAFRLDPDWGTWHHYGLTYSYGVWDLLTDTSALPPVSAPITLPDLSSASLVIGGDSDGAVDQVAILAAAESLDVFSNLTDGSGTLPVETQPPLRALPAVPPVARWRRLRSHVALGLPPAPTAAGVAPDSLDRWGRTYLWNSADGTPPLDGSGRAYGDPDYVPTMAGAGTGWHHAWNGWPYQPEDPFRWAAVPGSTTICYSRGENGPSPTSGGVFIHPFTVGAGGISGNAHLVINAADRVTTLSLNGVDLTPYFDQYPFDFSQYKGHPVTSGASAGLTFTLPASLFIAGGQNSLSGTFRSEPDITGLTTWEQTVFDGDIDDPTDTPLTKKFGPTKIAPMGNPYAVRSWWDSMRLDWTNGTRYSPASIFAAIMDWPVGAWEGLPDGWAQAWYGGTLPSSPRPYFTGYGDPWTDHAFNGFLADLPYRSRAIRAVQLYTGPEFSSGGYGHMVATMVPSNENQPGISFVLDMKEVGWGRTSTVIGEGFEQTSFPDPQRGSGYTLEPYHLVGRFALPPNIAAGDLLLVNLTGSEYWGWEWPRWDLGFPHSMFNWQLRYVDHEINPVTHIESWTPLATGVSGYTDFGDLRGQWLDTVPATTPLPNVVELWSSTINKLGDADAWTITIGGVTYTPDLPSMGYRIEVETRVGGHRNWAAVIG